MSDLDGRLDITWPNTIALARLAEEMEFEALVPIGRWNGFGGVTNFNGPGFECFSWASAIGASRTTAATRSLWTPIGSPDSSRTVSVTL